MMQPQHADAGIPLYSFTGPGRLLAFGYDYPVNWVQAPHRHDVPQLLHAIRGTMRVLTPHGYFVIPPTRGMWIPAGVPHEIQMRGEVAMRSVFVASDAGAATPASCAVIEMPPLLQHLLVSLVSVDGPPDPRHCPRRRALEELTLLELQSLSTLPLNVPLPKDPRLLRSCRAFLERIGDGVTLARLAEQAGASDRTLRRLFAKELGMSFAAWRQQALLVEACARLSEGQSVRSVAHQLGYATASAFTVMFKRSLGVSPVALAAQRSRNS